MNSISVGLMCALLLVIQYGKGENLNVTSPNSSIVVVIGDPINMTISYNATPSVILWTVNGSSVAAWLGGEQIISANFQNRVKIQEKRLDIMNSNLADSGEYKVQINDTKGDMGFFLFNVLVTDVVQEIQSYDSGVYKTGANISLAISYHGDPTAIFWDYNSSPLFIRSAAYNYISSKHQGRMTISENGSLLIYNTTIDDAGNYSITVTTSYLPGSRSFQVKFYDDIRNVTVVKTPDIIDESTPDVNLTCKATSGSGSVTWTKDGQPVNSNSAYFLLDQKLQILHPNRSFSGTYTCNMSNLISWSEGSIILTVYSPVENVTVTQSPMTVSENTSLVTLSCSASSGYIESVTWMKDGQPLTNNTAYNLLDGNHTLQIKDPKRTFSGNYSCNISNAVYWQLGYLQLRVYDPVENVTVTQSPMTVSENTSLVTLSCSASSGYIESVTWMKDGQPLTNDTAYNLLDGNHTLHIKDPKRTFSGNYSCTISNAAYWQLGSLLLRVCDPVENVTVTQSPMTVSENTSLVTLSCSASSGYIESVTWMKDGQPLTNDTAYNLLDGNHTLHIKDPKRTFSGNYSCTISNAAYWQLGSLLLRVYDPVENVTVTQSPNVVSEDTSSVSLNCSCSSSYIDEVTWMKDEQSITNDSTYNLLDNNYILQINNPNRTLSGNYRCNISNQVYWDSGSLQLRVYDPVLNVTVTQFPDKVCQDSTLVDLTCDSSSGYIEAVTWWKDGQSVTSKNPYTLLNGNKTLRITKPKKEFNGKYTCIMSNAAYDRSASLTLTVSYATPGATSTLSMMIITLLGGLFLAH